MNPTPSDLELYRALKSGQTSAVGKLYDCYGELMYGLAFKILGNHQETEDLMQEVFLGLWQNFNYNPTRGSLKSFLILLVRSRAIDRLRAQKTALNILEHWEKVMARLSIVPLEEVSLNEISQRVREALAQLPEKQRRALEMAYYGGLSQSEISQHLNVPLGTVKSWFRLGFLKMRHTLRDLI